jgi:hypothetical protein
MMRRMTQLLAILLLALPAACSDSGSNGGDDGGGDGDLTPDLVADQTTDLGGDPPAGCWTTNTATNFATEAGDWGDCITGCENDNPVLFNFQNFRNAGWRAAIDGESHNYTAAGVPNGPDLDLIGVILPPRTLLTLYVEPTPGSQINAVITTHDGLSGMTFNADAHAPGSPVDPVSGSPYARTQVANPWVTPIPFYFYVEHFANYNNFPSTSFAYEGGNHGYIVRYDTSAVPLTELGELTAGGSLSGSGRLSCYGDVVYFRYTGGVGTVTLTRTGAADLVLYAAGMDTTGGQLVWKGRAFDGSQQDGNADGVLVLEPRAFADGGTNEFIFAVTDFNGAAGPGDFTFDVSVQGQ